MRQLSLDGRNNSIFPDGMEWKCWLGCDTFESLVYQFYARTTTFVIHNSSECENGAPVDYRSRWPIITYYSESPRPKRYERSLVGVAPFKFKALHQPRQHFHTLSGADQFVLASPSRSSHLSPHKIRIYLQPGTQ